MIDEKLYARALRFLAKRPRSEREIIDNLKKKKTSDEQITLIIAELKEYKFLNDEDFAKWWIDQRKILKPMGWRVLELELKQKGISKEIIEELRSENQELGQETEREVAMKLAEKRFKRLQEAPKDEVYRKIGGFLARRGFAMDTIKAVIDQLLQK